MASWKIIVGLILSGFGILYSLSSFAFFVFGNYDAAFWSLNAGILSAIDFHLLFLHWQKTLDIWHTHETIRDIEILGVVNFSSGLAFCAWYIFVFLYHNLPILPVDTSYQIAAVSAFLAAKYALGLIVTTIHLGNDLRENMSAYHS